MLKYQVGQRVRITGGPFPLEGKTGIVANVFSDTIPYDVIVEGYLGDPEENWWPLYEDEIEAV